MPARASVKKTARPASVGGEGSADTGSARGRIGRVELPGSVCRRLHGFERGSRAGDGTALLNIQPLELFKRDHPSALRHAPARETGSAAGNGNGDRFTRSAAKN